MPSAALRPLLLLSLALGLVLDAAGADALAEARLRNRSRQRNVALGFPRYLMALKATGEVRMKTIFVDFSDAVATQTPQAVFALLSPGSEDFMKANSYGRMQLKIDPVFVWLRMSKRSDQYGWGQLTSATHKAYIQEAVKLAMAAGADFSTSDTIAVIANPEAKALQNGPTYFGGILTATKTIPTAITSGHDLLFWGYKWLNHETGHMLGLPDLYDREGEIHRHVGDYDLMGLISGTAPEYFGWARWLLGWLDNDQVICAPVGTSTATLTPLETRGGKKLLVIPTGPASAVVVENRQPLGFDSALTKPGPLAYVIDTSIDSGQGPLKVLPLDPSDSRKLSAPLDEGQTLVHLGASIKFISQDADSITLEIVRK